MFALGHLGHTKGRGGRTGGGARPLGWVVSNSCPFATLAFLERATPLQLDARTVFSSLAGDAAPWHCSKLEGQGHRRFIHSSPGWCYFLLGHATARSSRELGRRGHGGRERHQLHRRWQWEMIDSPRTVPRWSRSCSGIIEHTASTSAGGFVCRDPPRVKACLREISCVITRSGASRFVLQSPSHQADLIRHETARGNRAVFLVGEAFQRAWCRTPSGRGPGPGGMA